MSILSEFLTMLGVQDDFCIQLECYVPHYLVRIDPIFFRWDKERSLWP
ncbi:MAG: hypothetical protein BECKG1743E_GA0114224_102621, partial [Candidatus Kentron sp. G]